MPTKKIVAPKIKKSAPKKEKAAPVKPVHQPAHHAPAKIETPVVAAAKKSSSVASAVGRRKSASARVRLYKGEGKITINGLSLEKYFPYFELQETVIAPLKALGKEKDLDISSKVVGGGKNGQAKAVRLGVARALVEWNADFRKTLKSLGFLTRDPRVKERKKFGLKRARRAPQWSKR